MITIGKLTNNEPDQTQYLNLTSTAGLKIHKIQGLQRFRNLTTLIMNNHMIGKIEGLKELTNLKILNLEFNQIKILEGLEGLVCLEQLYLSYNSIRIIRQKLENFPCLRILHVAYNDLTIDNLSSLASAGNLTILSLHGNPLTKQITYHTLIGLIFNKLVLLDEKEVRRVQVDLMTEQVVFLRGALNEVLKEKNEIIAQATKIKKQLTMQSDKNNRSQEEKQQKMFYVEALNEQNKILQAKINQAEKTIRNLHHRQKLDMHSRSIRVAQHLQQQAVIEQLTAELEQKYTQVIGLERRLQKLERENGDLRERQRLLSQLTNNEQIISSCQSQIEAIKRKSQEQSMMEESIEQSIVGQVSPSKEQIEVSQLQQQLDKYRQKMEQNLYLISQYRQELRSSRKQHNQSYHSLIFGNASDEFTQDDLDDFRNRYPEGLLPTIAQLFKLTFGKYVRMSNILALAEKLQGVPLVKFLGLKKSKPKQASFLIEKQQFIKQFQKQTKELSEQWSILNLQKRQFVQQLQQRTNEFQEQMLSRQQAQQKKLKEVAYALEQLELRRETLDIEVFQQQQVKIKDIRQLERQLKQLNEQFQVKFKELEQFQKHFAQLKAQKHNLLRYQSDIEELKKENQTLLVDSQNMKNSLKEMEAQEQLLQSRVSTLQAKAKERLNDLIEIDAKYKELSAKISKVVAQHNSLLQQIGSKQNQIRILDEQLKDFQRSTERARANYNHWQDKLTNLKAIEHNKKQIIMELEQQVKKIQEIVKSKQKTNDELQQRRDRIMEQNNSLQLKLIESRTNLESLTNLNNAISKMSAHHKELKAAIIELQIELEAKNREKQMLTQNLKDLYDQQSRLKRQ